MKKLIIITTLILLFLVGLTQAQNKKSGDVNLFELGAKGLVQVKETPSGNGSKNFLVIEVPPSWWKNQNKATKQSIVKQGLWLAKAQKKILYTVFMSLIKLTESGLPMVI